MHNIRYLLEVINLWETKRKKSWCNGIASKPVFLYTHTHTRLYKAKVIGSDLVMLALGKSEYFFFFCVLTGK